MINKIILFVWAFLISSHLQAMQQQQPVDFENQEMPKQLNINLLTEQKEGWGNKDMRNKIEQKIISPAVEWDIKNAVNGRYGWKRSSDVLEVLSQISFAASGVLAFSSDSWPDIGLSFAAGVSTLLGFTFLSLSKFAIKESKERTVEANIYLKKLGIDELPIIDNQTDKISLNTQKM